MQRCPVRPRGGRRVESGDAAGGAQLAHTVHLAEGRGEAERGAVPRLARGAACDDRRRRSAREQHRNNRGEAARDGRVQGRDAQRRRPRPAVDASGRAEVGVPIDGRVSEEERAGGRELRLDGAQQRRLPALVGERASERAGCRRTEHEPARHNPRHPPLQRRALAAEARSSPVRPPGGWAVLEAPSEARADASLRAGAGGGSHPQRRLDGGGRVRQRTARRVLERAVGGGEEEVDGGGVATRRSNEKRRLAVARAASRQGGRGGEEEPESAAVVWLARRLLRREMCCRPACPVGRRGRRPEQLLELARLAAADAREVGRRLARVECAGGARVTRDRRRLVRLQGERRADRLSQPQAHRRGVSRGEVVRRHQRVPPLLVAREERTAAGGEEPAPKRPVRQKDRIRASLPPDAEEGPKLLQGALDPMRERVCGRRARRVGTREREADLLCRETPPGREQQLEQRTHDARPAARELRPEAQREEAVVRVGVGVLAAAAADRSELARDGLEEVNPLEHHVQHRSRESEARPRRTHEGLGAQQPGRGPPDRGGEHRLRRHPAADILCDVGAAVGRVEVEERSSLPSSRRRRGARVVRGEEEGQPIGSVLRAPPDERRDVAPRRVSAVGDRDVRRVCPVDDEEQAAPMRWPEPAEEAEQRAERHRGVGRLDDVEDLERRRQGGALEGGRVGRRDEARRDMLHEGAGRRRVPVRDGEVAAGDGDILPPVRLLLAPPRQAVLHDRPSERRLAAPRRAAEQQQPGAVGGSEHGGQAPHRPQPRDTRRAEARPQVRNVIVEGHKAAGDVAPRAPHRRRCGRLSLPDERPLHPEDRLVPPQEGVGAVRREVVHGLPTTKHDHKQHARVGLRRIGHRHEAGRHDRVRLHLRVDELRRGVDQLDRSGALSRAELAAAYDAVVVDAKEDGTARRVEKRAEVARDLVLQHAKHVILGIACALELDGLRLLPERLPKAVRVFDDRWV
mmetsp:Transcript_36124/g.120932  ORF Transcript_36124/g.120932 Transcript_36124/m.120932 type:complete len:972 (-) Transcript_36124:250-3165(-)